MKYFLSIILVLFLHTLSGQNNTVNPFDIPSKNPLDAQITPAQDIQNQEVRTPTIDSTGISSDSINLEAIEENEEQDISSIPSVDIDASAGVNPFDIGYKTPPMTENGVEKPAISQKKVPTSLIEPLQNTKIIVLVYSLIMLIILTLAISMDRKKFGTLIQTSYNSNSLRTLYRDTKAWTNGQAIILYVFFFFNFSFIIWFLNVKMGLFPEINLFMIFGACISIYLIRHIVMWSIARIFPMGQEVGLYNYSISLHNMVLGVFLLPFILALEFMPSLGYQTILYGVLGVVLIIYVMRQIKGVFLSFGMRDFNIFYFFIYLCAIEIAPILVVYKMISGAL